MENLEFFDKFENFVFKFGNFFNWKFQNGNGFQNVKWN